MIAFILITAQNGRENEIAENLKKIPEVKEAYVLYGDYDVIAKVEVEDLKRLNELRNEILKENRGILYTETLISAR
ncbi:Lrp/AsnC family transcriptional regulator [Thermococcus sp. M39]|uniref:Lrp/AsnC ligand binding domain-containing protein n=1 Tax=unclassified Thermococcus TaxID=2627626 RepID=UPI00143AE426|nr:MULTISPECIES: Lrp/AsnC ligand binding domain-containing protein [unclassified Thermococcus]NJE08342.1 Lrp/AsnC family transcriptional regulator [Thermococcus sp. M39]NJE11833.1 Lrp/AsnC family transcriptional regulator [Thermococcus sp. LS2]